jgi:hypothetical protein
MKTYVFPTLNTHAITRNVNEILSDAESSVKSRTFGDILVAAQIAKKEADKWLSPDSLIANEGLVSHFKSRDWSNLQHISDVLHHFLLTGEVSINPMSQEDIDKEIKRRH